jgi:hypothetical protein
MGFQSRKNPNQRQNDIWLQALCPSTMNTIRRKVMASPKSKLRWILWVRVCPWFVFVHQECYNYTLTNLVFGLCKFVWIVDLLVIIYSLYPIATTHPSYPKMLQVGEHIPIFFSFIVFTFRLTFESYEGFGGVSHGILMLNSSGPKMVSCFTKHPMLDISLMNSTWLIPH